MSQPQKPRFFLPKPCKRNVKWPWAIKCPILGTLALFCRSHFPLLSLRILDSFSHIHVGSHKIQIQNTQKLQITDSGVMYGVVMGGGGAMQKKNNTPCQEHLSRAPPPPSLPSFLPGRVRGGRRTGGWCACRPTGSRRRSGGPPWRLPPPAPLPPSPDPRPSWCWEHRTARPEIHATDQNSSRIPCLGILLKKPQVFLSKNIQGWPSKRVF